MTRYFILVKKKNARAWLGAIPTKKGVSLASARKAARSVKPGYSAKVITSDTIRRMVARRNKVKRRVAKRHTKRRKVVRRKRSRK